MSAEFAHRLYGFLIRRLGNREDAQDVAQESYLRLLRMTKTETIKHPEAYLFRIASNLANEYAMQQRAERGIPLDEEVMANDDGSFEQNLEHRAAIRRLEAVLTTLPPFYRAILLLSKRDGFSREEIAQKLGISVHTVKKYLARAAARVREKMTE